MQGARIEALPKMPTAEWDATSKIYVDLKDPKVQRYVDTKFLLKTRVAITLWKIVWNKILLSCHDFKWTRENSSPITIAQVSSTTVWHQALYHFRVPQDRCCMLVNGLLNESNSSLHECVFSFLLSHKLISPTIRCSQANMFSCSNDIGFEMFIVYSWT